MIKNTQLYEVQAGETLSSIADDYTIDFTLLRSLNNHIEDPEWITAGETLFLPGEGYGTGEEFDFSVGGDFAMGPVFDGTQAAPSTKSVSRANYIHPPVTNAKGQRSAAAYNNLINQFAVGSNPRYKRTANETWCNIFLWDVTRAMGAEIPHWTNAAGDICSPGQAGAHEININGGVVWMLKYGVTKHGWSACNASLAQAKADAGFPAVVMWKNTSGPHGHTAVVRPGKLTLQGPTIAQAGAVNVNLTHVIVTFGNVGPLLYFWHA